MPTIAITEMGWSQRPETLSVGGRHPCTWTLTYCLPGSKLAARCIESKEETSLIAGNWWSACTRSILTNSAATQCPRSHSKPSSFLCSIIAFLNRTKTQILQSYLASSINTVPHNCHVPYAQLHWQKSTPKGGSFLKEKYLKLRNKLGPLTFLKCLSFEQDWQ